MAVVAVDVWYGVGEMKAQRLRRIQAAQVHHKTSIAHSDTLPPDSENTAMPGAEGGKAKVKRVDGQPWWREYEEIYEVVKGWKMRAPAHKIAAYIAWASAPLTGRWPERAEDLAVELGLKSARSFRQWKDEAHDPKGLIVAEIAARQAGPLMRHRRDLYEAMIASATQPNEKGHNDRKLAFEMLGDYKAKPVAAVNVGVSTNIEAVIERIYGEGAGEADVDGGGGGDAEGATN